VDVILDGLENVLKVLFPFSFFFFLVRLSNNGAFQQMTKAKHVERFVSTGLLGKLEKLAPNNAKASGLVFRRLPHAGSMDLAANLQNLTIQS
jgi:hypothetical protein